MMQYLHHILFEPLSFVEQLKVTLFMLPFLVVGFWIVLIGTARKK